MLARVSPFSVASDDKLAPLKFSETRFGSVNRGFSRGYPADEFLHAILQIMPGPEAEDPLDL